MTFDIYRFGPLPTPAQAAALPPGVNGISVTTTWRALQPSIKGPIAWGLIDTAVGLAVQHKKHLYLRTHAGDGCPSDLPGMVTLPGTCFGSGPTEPASVTMPMPNDPIFLSEYGTFIKAFGARYNGNPAVTKVAMCGGSRQGEMVLPTCAEWLTFCTEHKLTAARLMASWERIVDLWRGAFRDHVTTLGMENPMGILGGLLSYMSVTYGPALIRCQQNGLRATTNPSHPSWWSQAHALGFKLGAQTWGDVQQGSGPLATELAVAEQLGLAYLEVYAQDVDDPANAALFAQYGNP
jgi:hypothetical protein